MVAQLQELVVPVALHHQSHDQFITQFNRGGAVLCCRHQLRPRLRELLDEQLLLDRQLLAAGRRHIGDIVEILPVNAAEGEALLLLGNDDLAHRRLDLAPREPFLEEPCAGLDLLRRDLLTAHGHGHQFLRFKQIVAAAEQCADCICSSARAPPLARPLLRKEPDLERLDRIPVAGHLVKSLDHDRLRGDRGIRPAPPAGMRIPPPHPLPGIFFSAGLHVGIDRPLPQAVDDRESRRLVARPG